MSVGVSISLDMPDLTVRIDDEIISTWIEERLNDGRNVFIRHMGRGGGGGRLYRRGGKLHSASVGGDFPVTDGGRLAPSTDYEMKGPREGVLGSDVEYAVYLALGTYKMQPRQMYEEALQEVMDGQPHDDELANAVSLDTGGPME